ncbi:transporter YfdV [Klebsiella sp. RIT-PI-d]|uniref:transporter YfdV n=1 Tax=Klebsiella sp. RIT-PI-d TaxID=1681196 RepID=UPI000675C065|nr:transporter YfdV [Klebsiella sp. RIT-PI-d]KNC08614.1 transporter YfdV [Klebsiella sp. RIT-PI-d]
MFTFFTGDLLPIIVIMLLGYISGKRQAFSEDQARALNKLVLNYALPAALFVSIARANRDMIFADTRLTLISLIVIVGCFLFSWFSCYKFFKRTHAEAAVCALIAGSPTVGFLGFAVLDPIYGASVSTGLVVAIISIIVNAITIPLGLYLLNPSADQQGKGANKFSALIAAAKEPVVWVPVLATLVVLVGIKIPAAWDPCFNLIAKSNSGVAVFAAGLTLAAHKFEFSWEIAYNTFLKLILMPLVLLIVGVLFHLDAEQLQMTVLVGALPPAFSGIIIASRFQIYTRAGTASLAVSVIGFMITAPMWIYISRLVS